MIRFKEKGYCMFGKRKRAELKAKSPKPLTKEQLEELETQFFVKNMEYLQGLSHRITMKRMNQYPDFQSYLAAYEDCIFALDELKSFCSQSVGGQQWFSSMYNHCHNSRNRDFDLEQQIRKNYKDFKEHQQEYQFQFERQIGNNP